jgi:hypothetical protein
LFPLLIFSLLFRFHFIFLFIHAFICSVSPFRFSHSLYPGFSESSEILFWRSFALETTSFFCSCRPPLVCPAFRLTCLRFSSGVCFDDSQGLPLRAVLCSATVHG